MFKYNKKGTILHKICVLCIYCTIDLATRKHKTIECMFWGVFQQNISVCKFKQFTYQLLFFQKLHLKSTFPPKIRRGSLVWMSVTSTYSPLTVVSRATHSYPRTVEYSRVSLRSPIWKKRSPNTLRWNLSHALINLEFRFST